MGKAISIANQKGGVGKTTTAINLGAALALAEKRVLLVDFDSQGNTTTGLGMKKRAQGGSSSLFFEGNQWEKEIVRCKREGFFLLPGGSAISTERVLLDKRERFRLFKTLKALKRRFDFILIDCPPSLGRLCEDALRMADSILVPVQCEFFAMEGLSRILAEAAKLRGNEPPIRFLEGILLTMYEENSGFFKEVAQEIQGHFKKKTFLTFIPRDDLFPEASSYGQSIITYNIFSKGARGYIELAREVL